MVRSKNSQQHVTSKSYILDNFNYGVNNIFFPLLKRSFIDEGSSVKKKNNYFLLNFKNKLRILIVTLVKPLT